MHTTVNLEISGDLTKVDGEELARLVNKKLSEERINQTERVNEEKQREWAKVQRAQERAIWQTLDLSQKLELVSKLLKKNKEPELTPYERAVELFGVNDQLSQMKEECSELLVAVSKYERALRSKDQDKIALRGADLLLELADVAIMTEQMLLITNHSGKDLHKAIKCKLQKLEIHLENALK